MKDAIVLISGGLDSATVAAIAQEAGFGVHALSFDYGQRHRLDELDAARRVVAALGITDHVVTTIDLRQFGGSALTADIDVPKHRDTREMGEGIPVTYVPARNTVFLSFALAFAESRVRRRASLPWQSGPCKRRCVGDAASFSRGYVGFADGVEQRGLAVIDVAHHGDDGRTRDFKLAGIFGFEDFFDGLVCDLLP